MQIEQFTHQMIFTFEIYRTNEKSIELKSNYVKSVFYTMTFLKDDHSNRIPSDSNRFFYFEKVATSGCLESREIKFLIRNTTNNDRERVSEGARRKKMGNGQAEACACPNIMVTITALTKE